jgi:hypothetical protein
MLNQLLWKMEKPVTSNHHTYNQARDTPFDRRRLVEGNTLNCPPVNFLYEFPVLPVRTAIQHSNSTVYRIIFLKSLSIA